MHLKREQQEKKMVTFILHTWWSNTASSRGGTGTKSCQVGPGTGNGIILTRSVFVKTGHVATYCNGILCTGTSKTATHCFYEYVVKIFKRIWWLYNNSPQFQFIYTLSMIEFCYSFYSFESRRQEKEGTDLHHRRTDKENCLKPPHTWANVGERRGTNRENWQTAREFNEFQ